MPRKPAGTRRPPVATSQRCGTRRFPRRPERPRVVAVELPPLPVVAHQLGVGLDWIGHVGGEDRVAVTRGKVDRVRLVALPCQIRIRFCNGRGSALALTSGGRNCPDHVTSLALPQHAKQFVALTITVPLVGGGHVEQLGLRGAVAFTDDQFQPAIGQVVQRRIVLECPDGIEQAQRGHRREQRDPRRPRCDVARVPPAGTDRDERILMRARPRRSRRNPAARRAPRCRPLRAADRQDSSSHPIRDSDGARSASSNRNFNAHPRHPAAWSLSRPQPHLVPAGARTPN